VRRGSRLPASLSRKSVHSNLLDDEVVPEWVEAVLM